MRFVSESRLSSLVEAFRLNSLITIRTQFCHYQCCIGASQIVQFQAFEKARQASVHLLLPRQHAGSSHIHYLYLWRSENEQATKQTKSCERTYYISHAIKVCSRRTQYFRRSITRIVYHLASNRFLSLPCLPQFSYYYFLLPHCSRCIQRIAQLEKMAVIIMRCRKENHVNMPKILSHGGNVRKVPFCVCCGKYCQKIVFGCRVHQLKKRNFLEKDG